ncbi:MAG TPA: choice-of-anchor M domain-containing protein [Actinomycetaceae bacterium]|nr:choice-of-anchor M domain-containing protein [Actinomycetaceae bacterium]
MKLTRRRPRLAAATLVAAVAFTALPTLAQAADLDDPIRLETGHIDMFNLALNDDNSIRLNLKEDVTGSHVQRTAESVELFVKDAAFMEGLPPAYLPPGAPTSLYFLPLTQDMNLIWPGWDSQGLGSYYGSQADVDFVISEVNGPGEIYLWSSGTFGNVVQILKDGYTLPDTIHQDFLAHVHASWGFTAPGEYNLTAQATVTSEDGTKTSTSNSATYTFIVGTTAPDSDPDPAPDPDPDPDPDPEVTLAITNASNHYHTGALASLTASQSPTTVSDHFHWFTRASDADAWEVVEGAFTDTFGFVVVGDQQVKAAIYDREHNVIAESAPVSIHVDDHGASPIVGPELRVNLHESEGALVVSVAPGSEVVNLTDLTLNAAADRYVSTGTLTGITVTDTRSGSLGWSATGRVRGFTSVDGTTIAGTQLGWTPTVDSATAGTAVEAGPAVAPGSGIAGWSVLGSATAGSSIGTAVLGAALNLEAPVATVPGAHTGVVLLTVI